jgi:hypothetical protein
MGGKRFAVFGLWALATAAASPATAAFPSTSTLPEEQHAILLCTVSDLRAAQDCGPPPGRVADPRTQAFIQIEKESPDYVVEAFPGTQVLMMIRRSAAAALDNANPGRAPPSLKPAPPSVDAPDWAIMPSPAQLVGYFPASALRNGVSGTATVECTVGVKGDLLGCWVDTENPGDMDFGVAALELSTLVQMMPAARDGSPTAGRSYDLQAVFAIDPSTHVAQVTLFTGF